MGNGSPPEASVEDRLSGVLFGMPGQLAVAVSGGVDSLTLATFAHKTVGDRVEMFHAVSPAVPGEATARVERLPPAPGRGLHVGDAAEFGGGPHTGKHVH